MITPSASSRFSFLPFRVAVCIFGGSVLCSFSTDAPQPPSVDMPPIPAEGETVMALVDSAWYARAESVGVALLDEIERDAGPESYPAARLMDALVEAMVRGQKGEDPKAMELIDRALRIKTRLLGEDHPEVARTLSVRANLLESREQLDAAHAERERALRILRAYPAADPKLMASICNNTGVQFARRGQFDEAEPYFKEALSVYEQTYGPYHMDTGAAAQNVGNLHFVRGEYAKAQGYYRRALDAYTASLAPDHPRTAGAIYSLGNVLYTRGDYAEARVYYRQGLDLSMARVPPDPAATVSLLRGLASIEEALGFTEEALDLRERGLSLAESHHGSDDIRIVAELNNLAASCLRAGDHDRARNLLRRSIAIAYAYDPEHDFMVFGLITLGEVEIASGRPAAAREALERGLKLAETKYGPEHYRVGEASMLLARVLAGEGSYAEALPYADRAVAILDQDHMNRQTLARSLLRRAYVRLQTEDTKGAFRDALRAEKIGREHFRAELRSLNEGRALRFAAFRGRGLDLMLLSVSKEGAISDSSAAAIWDAVVRSRSLILDEMALRQRLIMDTEDGELAELAGDVLSARARLATLFVRGAGDRDAESHRGLLAAAVREKEAAELALAERSVRFGDLSRRQDIGLKEVFERLQPGTVLVAYLRYGSSDPQPGEAPSSYAAFLKSAKSAPRLLYLGSESSVADRVAAWRRDVGQGAVPPGPLARQAETRARSSGRALRELVWDPVVEHIGDAQKVLVVLDGTLHLVNLAGLPHDDGGYLVERDPLIAILPSERAIVPSPARRTGEGLLALGGPAFGIPDLASVHGEDTSIDLPPGDLSKRFRGTPPDCEGFRTLTFAPLPGAEEECREIASRWSEEVGTETMVLTGRDASETNFKRLAGGYRCLHVATHGYFMGRECAEELLGPDQRVDSTELLRGNPLLLSGLAFSGSNAVSGPGEDGILTAEEIATLDLEGADWVVLSACGTGLGEMQAGEGIYGLQRAFQVAGVRTVVASLWPLDDEATRSWMASFYQAQFSGMGTVSECVRAAQIATLETRRRAGLSTHPFYWAGIVGIGE